MSLFPPRFSKKRRQASSASRPRPSRRVLFCLQRQNYSSRYRPPLSQFSHFNPNDGGMFKGGSVCVLVVFLVGLHTGFCTLRCYSCSSKLSSSCGLNPKVDDLSIMVCDQNALDETKKYAENIERSYSNIFDVDRTESLKLEMACLKVVTQVNHKTYVLRGCQLALYNHLDICHKLHEKNSQGVQMVQCSKCPYDHCNSSTKVRVDSLLVAMSLLLFYYIT